MIFGLFMSEGIAIILIPGIVIFFWSSVSSAKNKK